MPQLVRASAIAWLSVVILPGFAQESPPVQPGVEVQARGPVHEAFASPTADPVPTKAVAKRPPAPIEEVPPDEKPEGDVLWISGYWAWDDDRADFLWVSGIWRAAPPGRQWVAGYWREEGVEWQWVPGFWTANAKAAEQKLTYLPAPPAVPEVAPPPKPPSDESFFIPGAWSWNGERYVFRAGHWARMQPGYVWVPDHYRWTPFGYVYVPGYWDLALKRRGILYAPVVIDPAVVRVGFTYTPAYAVHDTIVVESLFVRPTVCHYYFGDYYGPSYRTLGYESCVVYSRRRYDSLVVYECYERRDPAWVGVQINLFNDRYAGRAPRPPRTVVQNNTTVINNTTIVNNNTTLVAPTKQVAVTKNTNLGKLDNTTRQQARAQAAAVQQVAQQRSASEVALKPNAPRAVRTASLAVPKTEPVNPGMAAPVPRPTLPPAMAKMPQVTPPFVAKPAAKAPPVAAAPKLAAPNPLPASIARPTPIRAQPNARPAALPVSAVKPAMHTQPMPAIARPQPRPQQPTPRPQPARRPPPKNEKEKR